MNLQKHIYYLREYFFPEGCSCCWEALLGADESYFGLCTDCRSSFESVLNSEKRCRICGKPLVSEIETCLSCRESDGIPKQKYNENFERIWSIFPYKGKFKAVLKAYKFKKHIALANFFVYCLNTVLKEAIDITEIALVPVPPKSGKIKKQGWDQIDFLSNRLKLNNHLPVDKCLKRLPSRSQKELNREERSKNLKGRILCVKKPPKNAILFDDVITTGATLNACAEVLREGGTEKVFGVCLFFD